jgi:DNA-binding NarL/FixJ family response regulator
MEAGSSTARLVGRIGELERLGAALEQAADGRGSTVLVTGDAGIGKTRLVAELAERARAGGANVLSGRCIDLVGAGLPYLPFADALRHVGGLPAAPEAEADAQLRLFEEVLETLQRVAAAAPLVLVLEDLHWADGSTLDLTAFLAQAVGDSRILVVATYRGDELRPPESLRTAADVIALRPLAHDEIEALLEAAAASERLPTELTDEIFDRSEGNPFFAEELYAASVRGDERLPLVLRDVLLRRFAGLDARSRAMLRVAAAAGRDVPYRLLAAVVPLLDAELADALRQAVDGRVLSADRTAGTFRFRHALLAEGVYGTLLPGEREDVHGRLAVALAADRSLADAGELAHHWTIAGRPAEALAASVEAARRAQDVAGLGEALRRLEHALDLWERVPDAEERAGMELQAVLAWAAELADLTADAPRAAQLARRAIDLVGDSDPVRAGLLYERLGSYLMVQGDAAGGVAAFRRAAQLVPQRPPSVERARVVAALANALQFRKAYEESLRACDEVLALAEAVGDERPAVRALSVAGMSLCYLGRVDEGLERLHDARRRAEQHGLTRDLTFAYVAHCDVLLAAGRLREAADVALEGIEVARRLGLERGHGVGLAVNAVTALVGTGEWDRAEEVLAGTFRAGGTFWRHHPHLLQAELDIARGSFESARVHLDAASTGRTPVAIARRAELSAELALWEGRLDDAAASVADGLRRGAAEARPRLCALGLRAEADRVELAGVRRDRTTLTAGRRRARELAEEARRATDAVGVFSPEAAPWRAVADAELARAQGADDAAERWRVAVDAWDAIERPYPAAYCRWRLAEAIARRDAPEPAREAYRVARRLRARPLQRQLELLAQRTRIDLADLPSEDAGEHAAFVDALGITPREAEVLELVARGYTNREIGTALFVSTKTASVHVSNILRKLGVSSRVEAAALAHRVVG